jgi:hypothetical protein
VPLIDPNQDGPLLERITLVRYHIGQELGFVIPGVLTSKPSWRKSTRPLLRRRKPRSSCPVWAGARWDPRSPLRFPQQRPAAVESGCRSQSFSSPAVLFSYEQPQP